MTNDPAITLPGRSLVWVHPLADATGFEALCDCAHITEVTVDIDPCVTGARELAWTCDGCQTPHWFTIVIGEQQ